MIRKLVSLMNKGFGRNIEKLPNFTGNELFHIYDVFDEFYLQNVVENKGQPGAVISDTVLYLDTEHCLGLNFFGLPLWAMRECRQWSPTAFIDDQSIVSKYVFNFMINKKQCSRYMLMKLVEIGKYDSFQYTWSGIGKTFDMTQIIVELDNLGTENPVGSLEFKSQILSPVSLPSRFFSKKDLLVEQTDCDTLTNAYGHSDYGGNKFTWDNFLRDLFQESCISLISETGNYNKLAVLSEKTLYAFFGLTFPIWVGNYAQAHAIQQIGLDVFDDVINHSYQWCPTLVERCYWAFELNKKILSDLEFANDLRQQHKNRLLANRNFLLNDGLGKYCQDQIEAMPDQHQESALQVKRLFDYSFSNMTRI